MYKGNLCSTIQQYGQPANLPARSIIRFRKLKKETGKTHRVRAYIRAESMAPTMMQMQKGCLKHCRLALVSLAAVLVTSVATAQKYTAVVLQSPDTVQNLARGVSAGAGAGTFYTFTPGGLFQRALLWPSSSSAPTVLNPSDAQYSYANAIANGQVGGAVYPSRFGGGEHAALWIDGTADNYVDLHPAGFNGSFSAILGMDPASQVGYAQQILPDGVTLSYHAILWNGSAASAVDLFPNLPGASHAIAAGCGGGQQAGWTVFNDPGRPFLSPGMHAFLWNGTAASAVDLHPDGFLLSAALGTDGNQQVGYAYDWSFNSHALVWTGSAGSVVDLTPATASSAQANACRNGMQVGWVQDDSGQHAAIWSGTADSVINLDAISGSGFDGSVATGIDENGVIVGYTNNGGMGSQAVMWIPLKVNQVPVADAGADQNVTTSDTTASVVLDGSASYDPDAGDTLTYQWTDESNNVVGTVAKPTVQVPLGIHTFTLVVTDNHGAASAPSTTHVTVTQANHPPTANAGPDQTVQATGLLTPVTLNGSGSSDPDAGDTLTYKWTDESNNIIGTSAVVSPSLGLGLHTFTLVVTDNHGASSAPSTTHVTVQDTTPPTISGLSASPNVIPAPSRKWILVTVSYSVADNCDPNPLAALSLSSSDPRDGDDAYIVDSHHIRVKADRRDGRKGRIYTITVTATDHSGNSSSASVTVTVARDGNSRDRDQDHD